MENYGILVVDDEPAYHAILTASLTPLGCSVDCVDNTADAEKAVVRRRYDLILMDIQLGGEDGIAVAARLRASVDWVRECPIIAFTSLNAPDGEAHFQGLGLAGLLAKPFTVADIFAMARRWLGLEARQASVAKGNLAALLGEENAIRMIDRFRASLHDAIVAIDGGAESADYGHRLGGLAGTLGFPVLSASWLALQYGDTGSWPTVRALTREAMANL